MNEITYTYTFQEHDLSVLVDMLYPCVRAASIVAVTGSLGAGKTTLIRELLRKLGVTQGVTSPTFTYMNVYKNRAGQEFYHFDLYRIKSLDDFMMAGFDEYLYKENSKVFIEWPEHVMPLLYKNVCMISLEYVDHDTRICTYQLCNVQ